MLLPGVSVASEDATGSIAGAVSSLHLAEADLVIVVSPHGRAGGVHKDVAGSLDDFGLRGFELAAPPGERCAAELAARWGRPLLVEPVDHGILVPLLLMGGPLPPVVAVTIEETTGPGASEPSRAVSEGAALAVAIRDLNLRRCIVVASAHTSAALSARAPLTERPGARALEERLLDAVCSDAHAFVEHAGEMGEVGGACGIGPLVALGVLFAGAAVDVVAYERPFGVGYLVASVGPGGPA